MQRTTWFLAGEDAADAIASAVMAQEHAVDDQPRIELPLLRPELMALCATLRGAETVADESTLEDPFIWDEDGLVIARVKDSFIHALAGVRAEEAPALAEAWARRLTRKHLEPAQLRQFLSDMARFALEAVERQSPVLEFVASRPFMT